MRVSIATLLLLSFRLALICVPYLNFNFPFAKKNPLFTTTPTLFSPPDVDGAAGGGGGGSGDGSAASSSSTLPHLAPWLLLY